MKATRRTDYAIRMLVLLASSPDEFISVRDMAKAQLVPYSFARNIQRDLVAANLAETKRGAGGGIRLARPSNEIAISEVIQAMQGDMSCSVCKSDNSWCIRMGSCKVHGVWVDLDGLIADYLADKKLSDVI